jgi:hypothetical protein
MIEVPVELVADADDPRLWLPYVAVEVDGSPIRALLDTGAARTSLVQRPELAVAEPAPDSGTGAFGVAAVKGSSQVGLRFAGRDLGTMSVAVVSPGDANLDDLVGQDVLSQFRCEYRLTEGRLLLDGDLPDEVRPIHLDVKGHIYLDATWSGTAGWASVVFDTGSSVTVVDRAFFERHRELFVMTGRSKGTDAAGGVREAAMATMRGPVVLGRQLSDSLVAVVDLSAANSTVDRRIDLILGWPIVSQAAWVIDHEERVAACRPTPEPAGQ